MGELLKKLEKIIKSYGIFNVGEDNGYRVIGKFKKRNCEKV